MNFPKIDWLQKDEDSIVTEEELDRPYAFYKRIYTRREFEELREKAEAPFRRRDEQEVDEIVEVPDVSPCVIIKGMSDEERFFDSFDYIFANREIIYADKRLASSMPIKFGHQARWIGGRILALADILHLWEQGKWKWECPQCGQTAYLFWSSEQHGSIYCPKCKERIGVTLVKYGKRYTEHWDQAKELLESLPYKRRNNSAICWTRQMAREFERMHTKSVVKSPLHSYKEVAARWKVQFEMPSEVIATHAQFKVAKMHGEKIAKWLEEIEEKTKIAAPKKRIAEEEQEKEISEVEKIVKRIKELEESALSKK